MRQRHEGGASLMCFYCLLVMQSAADFIKHIEVCDTFAVSEILSGIGIGKPVWTEGPSAVSIRSPAVDHGRIGPVGDLSLPYPSVIGHE